MADVTAYVDRFGDLLLTDTNETARRATAAERRESGEERTGTGNIAATVSERTLRRRCPRYVQQCIEYRGYV